MNIGAVNYDNENSATRINTYEAESVLKNDANSGINNEVSNSKTLSVSEKAMLRFTYGVKMLQNIKARNETTGIDEKNYMEEHARAYADVLAEIQQKYADDTETLGQHKLALLEAYENNMNVAARDLSSKYPNLEGFIQIDITNSELNNKDYIYKNFKSANEKFIDLFLGCFNGMNINNAINFATEGVCKENNSIISWLFDSSQNKVS